MAIDRTRKLKILISNDDGVSAPGIEALVQVLSQYHQVVVAAPADQQSAKSQALTMGKPIYVDEYEPFMEKYGVKAIGVAGTPSDSVKLYMEGWPERIQPDVVLSGINYGSNLGTDFHYSGTVGAALEGFIHNVDAMAISIPYKCNLSFQKAAEIFAAKLPELLAISEEPRLLNVNFPHNLEEGYKWVWAHQGVRDYVNAYIRHQDEDGRIYYVVGGQPFDQLDKPYSDVVQHAAGNITVTPLLLDKSDYGFLAGKLGKEIGG